MKRKEKVVKGNVISGGKRFGAYLADLVIFLIITVMFYSLAVMPLTRAITPIKQYENDMQESFQECQDLLISSKLLTYNENREVDDTKETFRKDLSFFLNDNVIDEEGHYQEFFSYFYIEYLASEDTISGQFVPKDVAWVNTNVFQIGEEQNIFVTDDINVIASLSAEASPQLKNYYIGDINAESQRYFDSYSNILQSAWSEATNLFITTDHYFAAATTYADSSIHFMYVYSISSLITFTVFFFLYYLLVPILFKKGQTFAKKILKMGIFDENNKPIKNSYMVIRSLLLYIFSFHFILILPIFEIGFNCLMMPLFTIGGNIFYVFTLAMITFTFSIVNAVFMGVNRNHQSIHDFFLKTYVLDQDPDIIEETPEIEEDINPDGSGI